MAGYYLGKIIAGHCSATRGQQRSAGRPEGVAKLAIMELAHLNSYWPPATRETKIPLESKPQGTKEIRFPKNSVRGRYLATFSSNCFAINENQVAELVAAAILVATSGHLKGWVQDTCSRFLFRNFGLLFSASCKGRCRMDTAYVKDGYNSLRVCILQAPWSCESVVRANHCLHPRGFSPRGWAHLGGAADPSTALRISPADSDARRRLKLSKNEVHAVYPWGLGWSRRARVKSGMHRL